MSPRARIFVGAVTVAAFVAVGAMLLVSERYVIGGAVGALGVFRAWVLWRQVRAFREPDS